MAFRGSYSSIESEKGMETARFETAARSRFPDQAVGARQWRELTDAIDDPRKGVEILERLRSLSPASPELRLFISHRQSDTPQALEVARIAKRCGYEYWLDVEDPRLAGLSGPGNTQIRAILIAAIIEMALLNSTHIIAVLTPNSFGHEASGESIQKGPSLWIPYEYGRVKARTLVSNQAAAWVTAGAIGPLPEYLHLGRILYQEQEIEKWLLAT